MKNKYIKSTYILENIFRVILKSSSLELKQKRHRFSGDFSPIINMFYKLFRERIVELYEAESPFENGEIELDESYFGARRVRGKRGDKVYSQIVKSCLIKELLPIIKSKTTSDTVVYSDGFQAYDGLVNYGLKKHFRVSHSDNEFALGRNHINGIENFWGLCKVQLSKFKGIHKHNFYLHIKKCEFKYNEKIDFSILSF